MIQKLLSRGKGPISRTLLTKQRVFDIMKIQFKNALIRMVGTGEQSKNMLQRRNCKKSATSVGNGARQE
ncbi:TPA: hypothetical protein DEX28_01370 [Patescibacteria group bacterium]|nr:hypothetical protein [Patescibacteria group bacterium]